MALGISFSMNSISAFLLSVSNVERSSCSTGPFSVASLNSMLDCSRLAKSCHESLRKRTLLLTYCVGVLISCATPAESCPIASSFCPGINQLRAVLPCWHQAQPAGVRLLFGEWHGLPDHH